jgi:hypothetical protein
MRFAASVAVALLLVASGLVAVAEEPGQELYAEFVAALKDPAKLNEGLTKAATEDAANWSITIQAITSKKEAEGRLREYVNTELKYVGHSYKPGLTRPLDIYRAGCAASLSHLQSTYGAKPSYNLIEKSLLWLEATSRKE